MPTVTTVTPLGVDPGAAYAVLADPAGYPAWAPGGGSAQVAASDGTRATVIGFVDSPVGQLEQHVDYRFDPVSRTVEFAPAASSPNVGYPGSFTVAADGTLTYAIHVPDDAPSAEHIAAYLESTSMPELVTALRRRLGAPGT